MKTSLAMALALIGGTLIYTGFTEPNGNVFKVLRAAFGTGAPKAAPPSTGTGTQVGHA